LSQQETVGAELGRQDWQGVFGNQKNSIRFGLKPTCLVFAQATDTPELQTDTVVHASRKGESMTEYETMTKSILVKREGSPIYDISVTEIGVETDGDRLYVYVRQDPDDGPEQIIRIEVGEWPLIKQAIDCMIGVCVEQNTVDGEIENPEQE
jgi:hypothetical protein